MNKMIALILSFVLFILPVCAESIDVSSLSDDDLSSLYASILDEMNKRSMEQTGEIFPGVYVVGQDILPGKYVIQYAKTESSIFWIEAIVFANAEKYEEFDGEGSILSDKEEMYLDLEEGMVFVLRKGSVIIRSIPTPFWAVKK